MLLFQGSHHQVGNSCQVYKTMQSSLSGEAAVKRNADIHAADASSYEADWEP